MPQPPPNHMAGKFIDSENSRFGETVSSSMFNYLLLRDNHILLSHFK